VAATGFLSGYTYTSKPLSELIRFRKLAHFEGRLFWKLLVRAAGMENGEYHQIRIGEEPLFRLGAGCLGRPREESQTLASRHVPEVLQTNARQPGDFLFGKELLTRADRGHRLNLLIT
jgi:hypothetical protein